MFWYYLCSGLGEADKVIKKQILKRIESVDTRNDGVNNTNGDKELIFIAVAVLWRSFKTALSNAAFINDPTYRKIC